VIVAATVNWNATVVVIDLPLTKSLRAGSGTIVIIELPPAAPARAA
jgi:hypothetical protein